MHEQNADVLDVAADNAIAANEAAVKAALAQAKPELRAVGHCHYCSEPVDKGMRFCDDLCRDDYDHIQNRRRANGS